MTSKTIVQVYKPPGHWRRPPPGIGDYLRGACHLAEIAERRGVDLRFDVSATEFAAFIRQDPRYFVASGPERIAAAMEDLGQDRTELFATIDGFAASDAEDLLLCTNLGKWKRRSLPKKVRNFARHFFDFVPAIHEANLASFGERPYAVLSVRCGDAYFGAEDGGPVEETRKLLYSTIETRILRSARYPIVVMSDSRTLRKELGERYGMPHLDHTPQHGAFGNVEPVVRDLDLLRHSRFNYHINAWRRWWSGFSHYTSLIFEIPTLNIAPLKPPPKPWWKIWR